MPPEITLPASLQGVEAVRSVRTPAQLDYQFTAGAATSRFLRGIEQKKILGERCPVCGKVYVPPRGACPRDGVPTAEQVELPHVGTVTSFCVVNVAFYGSVMELPYTSANILLDGSHLSLMHLIQEIPAAEVRIGMRVEAVWVPDDELKPTLESIKWFRPTGEPDDPNVDIPGEDHGTGLGSWVGGVAPTDPRGGH
ncbi:MAG: hypothetical protein JWM05_290 [Acidimicrobiales bacterium]|nr:hypothetical protein [Acidimicrobiales bacterium]